MIVVIGWVEEKLDVVSDVAVEDGGARGRVGGIGEGVVPAVNSGANWVLGAAEEPLKRDGVVPKENAGEVTAEVAAEESAAGTMEEEEREPGEVAELEEPPAEVKGGWPAMGAPGL